jgi:hypothetical protein
MSLHSFSFLFSPLPPSPLSPSPPPLPPSPLHLPLSSLPPSLFLLPSLLPVIHRFYLKILRLLIRDTYYETGEPARLPACWPTGIKELKKFIVRKKIFCIRLTGAAKAEQKSLVPARQAQLTHQGRTPSFVLYSLSPQCPFSSISKVSRGHPSLVSLLLIGRELLHLSEQSRPV